MGESRNIHSLDGPTQGVSPPRTKLGGVVGGLAREALARASEVGIQVRRGRKALRITGRDRKARRLAWPVTSGKRGMGNFRTTRL
ncbi:hypothetical protein [Nitrosospira multiformis]|uniref:Uncharacterized protein n=1 Tax=Nitrosospira multiformis TaxID=1231 RepID=A0A1I7I3M5_9PROT|nr:hypothetical protein [Nitrosospira multiformis]SFU67573.1 hypothetical protein SAMN05216417_11422 [Nitrosospira multiformis]